ncbi:hypothetical protein Nepgr_016330 [Nepenthes gracilis]|uniref:Uncharacterized protein n=1 Tax=Nepenthes gracilis TaxID=150966 RepID=A0AAD3XRZ1_NEPGR|nr:hypothetical protein Nepgr_016330 [Nepenthes gracilis]
MEQDNAESREAIVDSFHLSMVVHKNPACFSQALEEQRKSRSEMLEQELTLSAAVPHHLHQGYQVPKISHASSLAQPSQHHQSPQQSARHLAQHSASRRVAVESSATRGTRSSFLVSGNGVRSKRKL